jgi:defect-in-organelle-trafficking protein DotD
MAHLRTSYLMAAIALLTGCASEQHVGTTIASSDPASIQLAEAATAISQSLYQLAEVEKAATPHKQLKLPDPLSYGMANKVSVDWTGPLATILQKVAKLTGYKTRIIGTEPSIPVVVSVQAENEPIGNILRNVAYQAHQSAQVMLYPKQRVIELRYVKS